jgi:sugar (pentulose or hexulose) kinase
MLFVAVLYARLGVPNSCSRAHTAAASMYVVGVDGGTESIRAGVYAAADGTLLASAAVAYRSGTSYPRPGWAEQDPEDWWTGLGQAVREAVAKSGVPIDQIKGFVSRKRNNTSK